MSDDILLTLGEDGVFREYDDTYDVVIHCESQEEQEETEKDLELLNAIYAFKKATKCEEILVMQKHGTKAWDENGKEHTMQPTDKWIPCSERLPDEQERSGWYEGRVSEPVLVTVGDGVTEAFTIDGVWNWYIDTDYYKEIPEKVTAWMPLPEPYKGE